MSLLLGAAAASLRAESPQIDLSLKSTEGLLGHPSSDVEVRLQIVRLPPFAIRATRTVITSARDDTGASCAQVDRAQWIRSSVGGDSPQGVQPDIFFVLNPSPAAKVFAFAEGYVELAVPSLDRNATVTARLDSNMGRSVQSSILQQARVDITVLVRNSESLPSFIHLDDDELTVRLSDPYQRIANLGFTNASGSWLKFYWVGAVNDDARKFHIFRIPNANLANVELRCWLITDRDVLKYPFRLRRVPLPPIVGGRR